MFSDASPLLIWGVGGHAVSILETASALGCRSITFVQTDANNREFEGYRCIGASDVSEHLDDHTVVIAVGDNLTRQNIADTLTDLNLGVRFATLVHPSAVVAPSASLGPGTVVLQGAIVGARSRIGDHCIFNTGASLDHESSMGNFSSLAPGVVTGGRVTIGERSAIGIGTAVRHGLRIGHDTVVGSASYVHEDVPNNVVAYGAPARVVRSRNGDDPYLS